MSDYSQILRIARSGNPEWAMRLFLARKLDERTGDQKLLTLYARLQKDLAKGCKGQERRSRLKAAADLYLVAFKTEQSTYPLINAASVLLVAGELGRSHELARRVLEIIERDPDEGETPYWREATRAEAHLLLGHPGLAKEALATAIQRLPQAHEDLAVTLAQFEWIIASQGGDWEWLEDYRPPCAMHFSGLIRFDTPEAELTERVGAIVAQQRPGYGFGALAAGADIIVAEVLLEAGAQLHVTLPKPIERFRSQSVAPYGEAWSARFDRLVECAQDVDVLSPSHASVEPPGSLLVERATLASMGACLYRADTLRTTACALTVSATGSSDRPYISRWLQGGHALHLVQISRADTLSEPAEGEGRWQLFGLARIASLPVDLLDRLAIRKGMKSIETDKGRLFAADPDTCLAFINTCLQADTNCKASFAIDVMAPDAPEVSLVDRLSLISQSAELMPVTTGKHSALIARALDPKFRAQEWGDLGTPYGRLSVWSARF